MLDPSVRVINLVLGLPLGWLNNNALTPDPTFFHPPPFPRHSPSNPPVCLKPGFQTCSYRTKTQSR
jgi:hypothetical protein